VPKNTNHGGASYAGHVDVSPDGVSEPDWVADSAADEAAELEGDLGSDSIERPKPESTGKANTPGSGRQKSKGSR
jgi:hypothetical protein